MEKPTPPIALKKEKILVAHQEERTDPYYWMRLSDEQKTATEKDDQTKEVYDYLSKENEYTEAILKETEPLQQKLFDEMTGRIKQDDSSVPYFNRGYWFYTRYNEGEEYPIYCRKKDSLEAKEEVMLNVNTLAKDHDYFEVGSVSLSIDNKILCYGVDTMSRRIYTLYFKDLETGDLLDDTIENTTGSGVWANDNKTIFYTEKNKVTLLSEKIKKHRLGQTEKTDKTVYLENDKSYYNGVYKTKSDAYIVIFNSSTLSSDYWILDANDPDGVFRNFTPREEVHEYGFADIGDKFYILTNDKAKNFRLMEVDAQNTHKSNWKEVIAHRDDVYIENIEVFKNHLIVEERKNGLTEIRIINQTSKNEHYIQFDDEAYTTWISTNPDFDSPFLRFGYSSLTTPSSVYDYHLDNKEKVLKKQQEVVGGHRPEDYKSERLMLKARDGQRIPVSLVYKIGFEPKPSSPLLLYAYGSYGHTIDPGFSSSRLSLLDRGFVFAIAHIRGGQMLGRDWYDQGKMEEKWHTFTDFIDCSQQLIEKQYCSSSTLYAMGGSAGGLLMGVIANEAPDLYNGIIAAVPFVDVLTTMSDPSIPLTTNEYDEWGNPEHLAEYNYIKSYSPYDNIRQQSYPNMLVTTGLFDSQVQYWEPAKWVAKIRTAKQDDNILLLHTNMETGHSGTTGRFKAYKEIALEYAFLLMLADIKE